MTTTARPVHIPTPHRMANGDRARRAIVPDGIGSASRSIGDAVTRSPSLGSADAASVASRPCGAVAVSEGATSVHVARSPSQDALAGVPIAWLPEATLDMRHATATLAIRDRRIEIHEWCASGIDEDDVRAGRL